MASPRCLTRSSSTAPIVAVAFRAAAPIALVKRFDGVERRRQVVAPLGVRLVAGIDGALFVKRSWVRVQIGSCCQNVHNVSGVRRDEHFGVPQP